DQITHQRAIGQTFAFDVITNSRGNVVLLPPRNIHFIFEAMVITLVEQNLYRNVPLRASVNRFVDHRHIADGDQFFEVVVASWKLDTFQIEQSIGRGFVVLHVQLFCRMRSVNSILPSRTAAPSINSFIIPELTGESLTNRG